VDKIKLQKKGETPSLLEESEANAVIKACNSHIGMKLQKPELGEVKVSDTNAVIVLNTITSLGIENGEITTFEVVAFRTVPAA
jgi:hypothetical protein